ncbi:sigma-70 family RNA polymerase sigma factor [Erythrobacter sp. SG61-1L]|uniref:sigma-70 family RNA polymerase sigma factor n=1 Tax=Erythrobacter sp. SG61-1L TaxID=1603897 RepID=UPI000A9CEC07|nr:sigma-70 family RNA polymerase sigma factor [Erythrobacter sp. SG61-1L]
MAQNDDRRAGCPSDDDTRLVALAGKGSVDAFTIIVERHSSALYRVAYRMLGDGAEAEDVVQECFARLWTQAANWSARGAGLVGWLHRVTMNLCLDRLRKSRPSFCDTLPEVHDAAPLADRRIEGYEARLAIERALDALPPHYRAALALSYFEGFPNSVACDAMDMNLKAFESLLVRARRQLRGLLESSEFSLADVEFMP